jgi:hypothetical protein
MLRRVATVAVGALTASAYLAHKHATTSYSTNVIFAQDKSTTSPPPPRATSSSSTAPPPPQVDVVSDSETVSAKYVIVGGGVAALHAVKAIRELCV